jgi:4-deoxy-L-threo-5-hexosulose-uronate ketol-isomerase
MNMEIRLHNSPKETKGMDTSELRENYLVKDLMQEDKLRLVYSHCDRLIIGGVVPLKKKIGLACPDELKAAYFLERREIGIINVGGDGKVVADGKAFSLRKLDALYLGMGTKEVEFSSTDRRKPALFYLLSSPAHRKCPNKMLAKEKATPVEMGDAATSNARTIYKYIHLDGLKSCQLVMGLTVLKPGSVWNSVPPHTHTRRSEVYFYFDLPDDQRVFHFMGEPKETRHIVVADHEAVISPPWSMHFGCGTSNYGFIWGMAGENQVYTDMDGVHITEVK